MSAKRTFVPNRTSYLRYAFQTIDRIQSDRVYRQEDTILRSTGECDRHAYRNELAPKSRG